MRGQIAHALLAVTVAHAGPQGPLRQADAIQQTMPQMAQYEQGGARSSAPAKRKQRRQGAATGQRDGTTVIPGTCAGPAPSPGCTPSYVCTNGQCSPVNALGATR